MTTAGQMQPGAGDSVPGPISLPDPEPLPDSEPASLPDPGIGPVPAPTQEHFARGPVPVPGSPGPDPEPGDGPVGSVGSVVDPCSTEPFKIVTFPLVDFRSRV